MTSATKMPGRPTSRRMAGMLAPLRLGSALLLLSAVGCAGTEMRVQSQGESARAPAAAPLTQRAVAQIPDAVQGNDADAVSPQSEEVETVSVPIEGTELVRGRSTVVVDAPIDRVRDAVLDFTHYPEFMPHYSGCKVLGRTATGARDLYMEIAALHGALKMWARVELPKPTIADGVETFETKFIEGNVRDFKAIWRLARVDDTHTRLSLEVFLQPKIPLPVDLLNEENISGSTKGVTAMRARAEQTGQ